MLADAKKIEENNLQTAEVLVEEPSAIEVEMAIDKLKMYKALLSLIWKQEALPNEWKESVIIPIYKKGDKTVCNNYSGISLLSTSYKILTNILVSRLTPYIDEIIGDYQCAFRRNRSTIDQIFKEKLYSILMNFGIPKKLDLVRVGKQVSDIFEIHNGLKQGDA
ncbi:hypothetical protein C0J52_27128, partial [Blattella germanica]